MGVGLSGNGTIYKLVGMGLSGSGVGLSGNWAAPRRFAPVLLLHRVARSVVAASYRRGAGPACPVPGASRARAAAQAMETARAQAAATLQAEMQARLPLPAVSSSVKKAALCCGGPLQRRAAALPLSVPLRSACGLRLAGGSSPLPSIHMSHGREPAGVYHGIGMASAAWRVVTPSYVTLHAREHVA